VVVNAMNDAGASPAEVKTQAEFKAVREELAALTAELDVLLTREVAERAGKAQTTTRF
jgi:voltage-gated sodium channel